MRRKGLARHPDARTGSASAARIFTANTVSIVCRYDPEPGGAIRLASVAHVELDQDFLSLAFRFLHSYDDGRGVVASHVLHLIPDRSLHQLIGDGLHVAAPIEHFAHDPFA